jgi:hypothetical protein
MPSLPHATASPSIMPDQERSCASAKLRPPRRRQPIGLTGPCGEGWMPPGQGDAK